MMHEVAWKETEVEEKPDSWVERMTKRINEPDYWELIDPAERKRITTPPRQRLEEKQLTCKCWWCGETMTVTYRINAMVRLYCTDECAAAKEQDRVETLSQYVTLKIKVMHERALRMLEKQEAALPAYKEASDVVLEVALEEPGKFQSSHEMIAIMELLRNRVQVKTQQKVAGHRVDCIIPEMNVVLEIDGYMHGNSVKKDSKRDKKVRQELGAQWEVVRIPTKFLEMKAGKLMVAIKEVYRTKQELREKNYGMIPDWYSQRDKEYYAKLLKTV